MTEAEVLQKIRLEAPKHGVKVFRNNVGATYTPEGRLIRYGLANDSPAMSDKLKSSDLIGITPHVVTQADVGKTVGIFTSIEVKQSNWIYTGTEREQAQLQWIELIKSLGGIGQFAASPEDIWPTT